MKLIKLTNDHYIIVDNSPIQNGDWYLKNNTLVTQSHIIDDTCKKITHSTEPLDVKITDEGIHLPDWSKVKALFSPKVVKELIGEVNVSKKAAEYANSRRIRFGDDFNDGVCNGLEEGYSLGYNQALEDNKEKKYTEEDLRRAIIITRQRVQIVGSIDVEGVIQSLQPKTEWEVEIVDGKLKLK